MTKPFGVFVCIAFVLYLRLKGLFLFLKGHIWHGPKLVTELGMRKAQYVASTTRRILLAPTDYHLQQKGSLFSIFYDLDAV